MPDYLTKLRLNIEADTPRVERKITGYSTISARLSEMCDNFIFMMNVSWFTPEFMVSNYPPEWLREYREKNYMLRDPVLHWAAMNTGVIRWDEIRMNGLLRPLYARTVFRAAARNGLNFGAVTSLRNSKSGNLICVLSMARNSQKFSDEELSEIQELLRSVMEGYRDLSGLSEAEVTTLQLLSEGKSQDEIAAIQGISRAGVTKRIERARVAVGARNTIHMISVAIKRGIITPK